jgi:hypothetical protein
VIQAISRDSLKVPIVLVTRLKAKRFEETFNELLQNTEVKVDFKKILNNKERALINLIHIQEEFVNEHSNITKIM